MFFTAKFGLFIGLVLSLVACGGGSGSTQSSSTTSTTSETKTGTFIDSPVMGLRYNSTSHSGITNSAGEFRYTDDEVVTFSLGGIELGSSIAQDEITPLDLLGVDSLDDAISEGLFDQLINMLVFLQSLDRDHNPENGIDLGDLDITLADAVLNFDQDQQSFLNAEYKKLVNENAGFYVSADTAKKHFADSLAVTYTVALPSKDYLDTNGDSTNDIVITYNYDGNGRLFEIFEAPDGEVEMPPTTKTTLQYDSESRISLLTYEDLTDEVLLVEREYNYDSMGRLTSLVESGPNSDIYLQESWVFDDVGNEVRWQSTISALGIEFFYSYQNPFDLFFNIKPYNPEINMQAPMAPVLKRDLPRYLSNILVADSIEVTSYETDGSLASKGFTYTAQSEFSNSINSKQDLTFDHGRILTYVSEADIEFFNFLYESEVLYNYKEDETLSSCRFLSVQNGIPSEIIVSYQPDIGDETSYSCGDSGFDEKLVFRDDSNKIKKINYNTYGGSRPTRHEQTVFYEEEKLVGVFTESQTESDLNSDGLIDDGFSYTTEITSIQYDYNSAGDLSFIEESSDGLRTLTREYQPIEIR
jgi:hypothetical protein